MQQHQNSISALEQAARQGDPRAALELGNRLLMESTPGSESCKRGLKLLEQLADGPQGPPARWLLGGFYLQNLSLPGGPDQAHDWLTRAIEARVAPAFDRLANMYLRGVGVDFDPARAVALLEELADAGFQRAAWEIGYLKSSLPEIENAAEAVHSFIGACALGFPPAYYSLGLRYALGCGVEPDPAFARALLLRARDAGVSDAVEAADAMAAAEDDRAAVDRWYAVLKENHQRARPLLERLGGAGMTIPQGRVAVVDQLVRHFAAIDHPSFQVDDSGRVSLGQPNDRVYAAAPSGLEWVCERPRIARISGFLTREERAQILSTVSGALMGPEQYAGAGAHGQAEIQYFDGKGMSFGALTSDSIIRCIERRIGSVMQWDPEAIEPLSVIAYQPGQQYHDHVDYFDEQQIAENERSNQDFGGQRVVTFLMCLQEPAAGGATYYPRVDLEVGHDIGGAMLHYNLTPSGEPDEMSIHHGLPVESGEKWLLRTTLRSNSRYRRAQSTT